MEGVTLLLVVVIVLAVVFDYINGFHDTANAIATSVATRALHPRQAIVMAAAFNFIGAFAGTAVAKTIGSGLVEEADDDPGRRHCGAGRRDHLEPRHLGLGLPSSSSHALIGGLIGATLVASGPARSRWTDRRQGPRPDGRVAADRVRRGVRADARDLLGVPECASTAAGPHL